MAQKDEKKTGKYTLKMEPLGNYLTFGNRPWNRPRKVLYSWKELKKELVKVLYPKKGTKEGTGEGSWLWLSLKRLIKIFFEEPLRSTGAASVHGPVHGPARTHAAQTRYMNKNWSSSLRRDLSLKTSGKSSVVVWKKLPTGGPLDTQTPSEA